MLKVERFKKWNELTNFVMFYFDLKYTEIIKNADPDDLLSKLRQDTWYCFEIRKYV